MTNVLKGIAIKDWMDSVKVVSSHFKWTIDRPTAEAICLLIMANCVADEARAINYTHDLNNEDIAVIDELINTATRLIGANAVQSAEIKDKVSATWCYGTGRMYLE